MFKAENTNQECVSHAIINECVPKLKADIECKEIFNANTHKSALNFASWNFRKYALKAFADRVDLAIDQDDDLLIQNLSNLAKLLGDRMESMLTRKALVIAYPDDDKE